MCSNWAKVKEPSSLEDVRNIWNKVRVTYGITVPRDKVMYLLRCIDPTNSAMRQTKTIGKLSLTNITNSKFWLRINCSLYQCVCCILQVHQIVFEVAKSRYKFLLKLCKTCFNWNHSLAKIHSELGPTKWNIKLEIK